MRWAQGLRYLPTLIKFPELFGFESGEKCLLERSSPVAPADTLPRGSELEGPREAVD